MHIVSLVLSLEMLSSSGINKKTLVILPSGEINMVLVRLQSHPEKQINIKECVTMLHIHGQ